MDKNTLISSFGKWVAPINFSHFEKQVAAINQDKYTKKLTTKAYLMLFLYAHLHEEESLRALSDAVRNEDLGQALGFDTISASQLSRKNREVDPASFNKSIGRNKVRNRRNYRLKSLTLAQFL